MRTCALPQARFQNGGRARLHPGLDVGLRPGAHVGRSARRLVCALLLFGALQSVTAQEEAPAAAPVNAQPAPLPEGARFDQPVSFRTSAEGEALDAMLQALARSVGLTAITQGVPDTVIRYDIGEPKPFREVWEIVLTLNGLEYVLRDPDIVVVGPPQALSSLRGAQVAQREPREVRTYTVNNSAEQFRELLVSQFAPGSGVDITAFEDLGLLSVRGTAGQQERVTDLLTRFDRRAATPVRRAYALSHAKAEDLAAVLQETILSNEQETLSAEGITAQEAEGGERQTDAQNITSEVVRSADITIAADVRTNRIIVTAPEVVQAEVAELIAELDQAERQVNIQVRIQEVTTDMTERLGINLSAGLDRFAATLFSGDATSGLSFIFDAQRAISGFNLGAILDVFENQGLSRRVDDSNLTVLNNGTATLQSGGTIYISIAGNGSTENIERAIEYGVQLELTPQITNDDEVILEVDGRVDSPVGDIDNPNLLQLTTRNLTSTVTLAPGQTVVLGGLLQNETSDTTRSVPGLSSVPVIGGLFSSNSATETTTELLVIVTANVLE